MSQPEEDEDLVWEDELDYVPPEPPVKTAEEQIEQACTEAKRRLADFISNLTAKHLREFLKGRMPDGMYKCNQFGQYDASNHYNILGRLHVFQRRNRSIVELLVSENTFKKRFSVQDEIVHLEDLGYGGSWFVKEWYADRQCRDFRLVHVVLEKVF